MRTIGGRSFQPRPETVETTAVVLLAVRKVVLHRRAQRVVPSDGCTRRSHFCACLCVCVYLTQLTLTLLSAPFSRREPVCWPLARFSLSILFFGKGERERNPFCATPNFFFLPLHWQLTHITLLPPFAAMPSPRKASNAKRKGARSKKKTSRSKKTPKPVRVLVRRGARRTRRTPTTRAYSKPYRGGKRGAMSGRT